MAKKKATADKTCEGSICSEPKKTAGMKKKERELKTVKEPKFNACAPVPIAPAPLPIKPAPVAIAPATLQTVSAPVQITSAPVQITSAQVQIIPALELMSPAVLPISVAPGSIALPCTTLPTAPIAIAPALFQLSAGPISHANFPIAPLALPIVPGSVSPAVIPIAPAMIAHGAKPIQSIVSSVQIPKTAATLVTIAAAPPALQVPVQMPHSHEAPTFTPLTKVEMVPNIKTEDSSVVCNATYNVSTQNDFDSVDMFKGEQNGVEGDMVLMPISCVKAEIVSQEELSRSGDLNAHDRGSDRIKDPYTPDFDADVNFTVLPPINRKRPYKPPLLTNNHKSIAVLELEAELNSNFLSGNGIEEVMTGNMNLQKKTLSKRKNNAIKNADGSTAKKRFKKEKDLTNSNVAINNVVSNGDATIVTENGEVMISSGSESAVKSKVTKPKLIGDEARKFACEKCGRKFKSDKVCVKHLIKCGLPKPPRPSKRTVEQTAKLPEQQSQEQNASLEGQSTPSEIVQNCTEGLPLVTDGQIIVKTEPSDASASSTAVAVDAPPKPSKPKQVFRCSQCEYVNSKKAVFVNHLETLHQIFRCVRLKCVFETESREVLEKHALMDHKTIHIRRPDMKKCKKCSKYIKCDVEPLEVHTEQCKGREPYMCQQCNKEFKYKFAYTNHMHSHKPALEPKKFSCVQCEYTSNFKANLQKHVNCIHEQRTKDVPCPECDKLFYTDEKMKKHKLLHTDVRPYTCDICQKAFKTKMTLRSHKDIHNMERKFTCTMNGCTKDFRTMQTLRKHQHMYHELPGPPKKFFCTFEGCTQNFFKSFHLKRHARTHSDERNFKCEWEGCGRAFRHEDNLTVHYRQHTNETPYSCAQCSFSCKQKTSLRYHLQTQHKPTKSIENNETVTASTNADLPRTSVVPDVDPSSSSPPPVVNTATQSSQTPIEGSVDQQNTNANNNNKLLDDDVTGSTVSEMQVASASSSDTMLPLPVSSCSNKKASAAKPKPRKNIVKDKTKKPLKAKVNNSEKSSETEKVAAESDGPENKEIVKKQSPSTKDQAKTTPKRKKAKKEETDSKTPEDKKAGEKVVKKKVCTKSKKKQQATDNGTEDSSNIDGSPPPKPAKRVRAPKKKDKATTDKDKEDNENENETPKVKQPKRLTGQKKKLTKKEQRAALTPSPKKVKSPAKSPKASPRRKSPRNVELNKMDNDDDEENVTPKKRQKRKLKESTGKEVVLPKKRGRKPSKVNSAKETPAHITRAVRKPRKTPPKKKPAVVESDLDEKTEPEDNGEVISKILTPPNVTDNINDEKLNTCINDDSDATDIDEGDYQTTLHADNDIDEHNLSTDFITPNIDNDDGDVEDNADGEAAEDGDRDVEDNADHDAEDNDDDKEADQYGTDDREADGNADQDPENNTDGDAEVRHDIDTQSNASYDSDSGGSLDDNVPDTPPRAPRPADEKSDEEEPDFTIPEPLVCSYNDSILSNPEETINNLPSSNAGSQHDNSFVGSVHSQPSVHESSVHEYTPQSHEQVQGNLGDTSADRTPHHSSAASDEYYGQYLPEYATAVAQSTPLTNHTDSVGPCNLSADRMGHLGSPPNYQQASPHQSVIVSNQQPSSIPMDLTAHESTNSLTQDSGYSHDMNPPSHTSLSEEIIAVHSNNTMMASMERRCLAPHPTPTMSTLPLILSSSATPHPSSLPSSLTPTGLPSIQPDPVSYQRMELLASGRPPDVYTPQPKESSLQRLTNITYQNFGSLDSVNATSRENYFRQTDSTSMFARPGSTDPYVKSSESDSALAARSASFLRQPESNFIRPPDSSLTRPANSALLRTAPVTEDLFSRDAMGRPVSRSPFHSTTWPTAPDIRTAHWNQNPYLQRPTEATPSSLLGKDNYLTQRDFTTYDSNCRSLAEQNMFNNLGNPQTHDAFGFDLSGYFGSHPYSATTALDYGRTNCGASQKAFEDRLRQPTMLPQPGASDMFCGLNMNPSFNLDKYMYARDSMYRAQPVAASSDSAFLSHTAATQPTYFDRDYARRTFYPQANPYSLVDGQYSAAAVAAAKFPHASTLQQSRDLMAARRQATAADSQVHDPYRRSVMYNVMSRYYE